MASPVKRPVAPAECTHTRTRVLTVIRSYKVPDLYDVFAICEMCGRLGHEQVHVDKMLRLRLPEA